jgi:hypothetical protein
MSICLQVRYFGVGSLIRKRVAVDKKTTIRTTPRIARFCSIRACEFAQPSIDMFSIHPTFFPTFSTSDLFFHFHVAMSSFFRSSKPYFTDYTLFRPKRKSNFLGARLRLGNLRGEI